MSALEDLNEYRMLKERADKLNALIDPIKKRLLAEVEARGTEDDKGHYWYTVGGEALQRQKRVTIKVDMDAAEGLLSKRGLWDDCTKWERVLDEDKLLAHLYDERLSKSDMDIIFPKSTSWAFVVPKK